MENQQAIDLLKSLVDAANERKKDLEEIAGKIENWATLVGSEKALSPAVLAMGMYYLKDVYEETDKQVKRIYHVKDGIDKAMLPGRLRDFDMDGIRVPEIARSFGIQTKTSASFVDKAAGFEWLREIGQGDMIQETVNAGTLSAFCRNMVLETGEEPPEDIVSVRTYDTMSMTKYKPKD